ncbi:MAG: helix-turn-helix transcriptional regulator, partial [Chloroflexi bacterium]|nr:helix-turn-helix transcriptional regulator [Chloroflexota bacterium]
MRTPAPAGDRPLSQLLRAWRSRKRLSLREVAAEAGVSAGYVQQLEAGFDPRSGRPIQPSPTVLQRIAAALGAPYEALMAAAGYLPET